MIKNIIFDLGGVILDTEVKKSIAAFASLDINFPKVATPEFWKNLNAIGSYSLGDFSKSICTSTLKHVTNQQIETAWIALLIDFNARRMTFLENLSQNYFLYLFSNTDAIHTKAFEEKCRIQMHRKLGSYFKQTFYSQNIMLRKPNVFAFKKVIQLANIKPEETLFIDDKIENVKGARQAGLYAYHLRTELSQLNINKLVSEL